MHPVIKLKVSDKAKTEEWYKEIGNYYIPPMQNISVEDYDEMKKIYELMNNDLSSYTNELKKFCNPLEDELEDELLPYNKLKNKEEVLLGDLLRRSNDHKIVLLSAKAKRDKNEQLLQAINNNVQQQLSKAVSYFKDAVEQMGEDELNELIRKLEQSLTPPDINHKNFLSETEIVNNKFLKYTYFQQDIKSKKLDSFKDVLRVDRTFLYNGWKHGKPHIQVLNPLFVIFNKSPDEPWIHKGDYCAYRDEITIGQAMDEYANKLSNKQLEELVGYSSFGNAKGNGTTDGLIFDHTKAFGTLDFAGETMFSELGVGTHQGNSLTSLNRSNSLLRVHLEFKAWKEVMFYTYKDQYGSPITIMLDNRTNIIPPHAEKIKYTNDYFEQDNMYLWVDEFGNEHTVKTLWVPRRYELTRLGSDLWIDMREVPFQPDNILNPVASFELSYKGGIVNSRNAKFFSLVQNAIPYYFQILAAKNLQNREMAKYEGAVINQDTDQIPDDLTLDSDGNPIHGVDKYAQQAIIRRKTGVNYYSGSQSTTGLPNHTRGQSLQIIQTSSTAEIINFEQLISLFDAELGLAMGVPPQRESQVIPGTNVTDNQQALIQSTLTTETYYFWHNKVWSHALNEHLMNLWTEARLHYLRSGEDSIFEYILPDGTKELITITPAHLNNNEVGIYLHDTPQEQRYIDMLTQKIMQNTVDTNTMDSMSTVLKAINSGASVEEIDKIIKMESDKIRQQQDERLKQEQQMQVQMKQDQMELVKYQSDINLQNKILEINASKELELEKARIQATTFALQNDINANQIHDDIEKEKLKIDADKEKQDKELRFKEKELNVQKELKEKEIKAKPKPVTK